MGGVNNITFNGFPKQGNHLNAKVEVCFHYDTSKTIGGKVVRDDIDSPHLTIIKLDDGRYVLGTECHYSPTGGQ